MREVFRRTIGILLSVGVAVASNDQIHMVLVQTLTICHQWSCPGPGTQAVTETRLTAFYIHAYTSLSLDTPTIGEGEIHGDLLL